MCLCVRRRVNCPNGCEFLSFKCDSNSPLLLLGASHLELKHSLISSLVSTIMTIMEAKNMNDCNIFKSCHLKITGQFFLYLKETSFVALYSSLSLIISDHNVNTLIKSIQGKYSYKNGKSFPLKLTTYATDQCLYIVVGSCV